MTERAPPLRFRFLPAVGSGLHPIQPGCCGSRVLFASIIASMGNASPRFRDLQSADATPTLPVQLYEWAYSDDQVRACGPDLDATKRSIEIPQTARVPRAGKSPASFLNTQPFRLSDARSLSA